MSNLHGLPDTIKELQALSGDLLPPCILSTTWPTVPASSLTLSAFATYGYAISGRTLVYIDQPAVPVTLPSAAGTYWLALHRDTSSAVSGWTRRVGSHYLFQASASQPAAPDGAVLLSSVTVAGAVITAVSQAGIRRAPMSRQDAGAVAITGGTVDGLTYCRLAGTLVAMYANGMAVYDAAGNDRVGFYSGVNTAGGTGRYAFWGGGTAPSYFGGKVQVGAAPLLVADPASNRIGVLTGTPSVAFEVAGAVLCTQSLSVQGNTDLGGTPGTLQRLCIQYPKGNAHGLLVRPTDGDSGSYSAIHFTNVAVTAVGSITTTATATAYNTTSDIRLKRSIQSLLGGLEALQRLRPVSFVWNSTDEPDIGFLAHELMTVAPNAVTGQPDEVNPDGSVKPQQVDQSKLVPILVAAVKELLARVEVLEQALGL